jgi:hypothetical protein
LQPSRPFLSLFPISPRLVVRCHPCLLTGNRTQFGPVTIGLKNLSNGVKGPSMRPSLPPCQRSPVPEPCSDAGRKHQYLVGLSLPNSILHSNRRDWNVTRSSFWRQ